MPVPKRRVPALEPEVALLVQEQHRAEDVPVATETSCRAEVPHTEADTGRTVVAGTEVVVDTEAVGTEVAGKRTMVVAAADSTETA